jgi:hypothetical protein
MTTDTLEGESKLDARERVLQLHRSCSILKKPKELELPSSIETKSSWNNSFVNELQILVRRSFSQELRDKSTLAATFGQSLVNIILLGFVFWRIPLDSKGKWIQAFMMLKHGN